MEFATVAAELSSENNIKKYINIYTIRIIIVYVCTYTLSNKWTPWPCRRWRRRTFLVVRTHVGTSKSRQYCTRTTYIDFFLFCRLIIAIYIYIYTMCRMKKYSVFSMWTARRRQSSLCARMIIFSFIYYYILF